MGEKLQKQPPKNNLCGKRECPYGKVCVLRISIVNNYPTLKLRDEEFARVRAMTLQEIQRRCSRV